MGLADGARFGDLQVLRRIGRGGMGEVYLVRNEGLDRLEALKVLRDDPDPDLVTRFRGEARIGGRLHHPRIVTVYDLFDVDGQLGLRMEYVDGPDLRAVGRQRGRLSPAEVVRVVTDVSDALDAAHQAGVLHRDVKPANILLPQGDAARNAVLTDFGIGLLDGSARLTVAGFIGTVTYTAPERLTSGESGPPGDVYSLACTAFEALTGHAPYEADSEHAVVRAHMEDEPPTPRTHVPSLPPAVDAVFAQALAKDPDRRPPTCGAFASDLAAALGTGPRPVELEVGEGVGGDRRGDGAHDGRTRVLTAMTSRLPADDASRARPERPVGERPADQQTPSASQVSALLVQVSPVVVQVAPGRPDVVDVRVHNEERSAQEVVVRVHPSVGCGISAGVAATVTVPAGGFADTSLTVEVPRQSRSRPGRHPYHVTVTRPGDDVPADRCEGQVVVGVYDEVAVQLEPSEARTRGSRRPVHGQLVLHNRGNREAVVGASVHHGPSLRPVLAPVRQLLGPGQSVSYALRLTPAHGFLLGSAVRHQVWAQAVAESSGVQDSASAVLVQRGRVPWWLLTGLLVLALLVLANALGAGVRP